MSHTKRILVVDDIAGIRLLVRAALSGPGFVVQEASTGAEALAMVNEGPPDLILLDLALPGMTGLEVLQQLQGDDRHHTIPVVIVTALAHSEMAAQAIELGATNIIEKPFRPAEIRRLVDQVTSLPRPLTLTTNEIVDAIHDVLRDMVESIRRVLEKTPPELVSDTIDRGVALCCGGALLRGIDKLMTKELGVPAYLVDNPQIVTAIGASRALEMYPALRRNLPQVA